MNAFIISTLGPLTSVLAPIFESAASSFLGNRFNEIRAEQRNVAKQAINDAFEEWLIAMLRSLQAMGYEDDDLRQFFAHYKMPIETFLNDPDVVEELLKPFFSTTSKYQIDSNDLARRWGELNLHPLPEDFDTAYISRAYLQRLKKACIVTSELRELFLAQVIQGLWSKGVSDTLPPPDEPPPDKK